MSVLAKAHQHPTDKKWHVTFRDLKGRELFTAGFASGAAARRAEEALNSAKWLVVAKKLRAAVVANT